MSNDAWYYLDGQDRRGPFSIEAMKQMLQAGVIQPETWVAGKETLIGHTLWDPLVMPSAWHCGRTAPET